VAFLLYENKTHSHVYERLFGIMLIGVLVYIIIISCSQGIILVDSNWVLCAHCQLFKGERVTTSVSEL